MHVATVTPPAPTESSSPKKIMLPPIAMKRLDTEVLAFWVKVPVGHTIEDLLNPMYWGHHCPRLKLWARIEALAEDGSFDADLRCVALAESWAKMRLLRKWEGTAADLVDPTPLRARYKDEFVAGKWRVKAIDTGKILAADFTNKKDAEAFIEQEMAKLRASGRLG